MSEVSGVAFTTPVGPPWAVLTALATELYLKALVMLESGNYPRIHELQDLYRRVSLAKQKRIKEFFNEVFIRPAYEAILRDKGKTVDPQEFEVEGALRRLNNAFVEYRYSFEGGNDETSIGDVVLCGAVMRTILEIKPEWEKFLDRQQRTDTTFRVR